MAGEEAVAAPGDGQQQEQGGSMWGMIGRCLIIWFIMQQVVKPNGKQQPAPPEGSVRRADGVMTTKDGTPLPPTMHSNAFRKDELIDLRVYVSDSGYFDAFDNKELLIWSETGLLYSTEHPDMTSRARNVTIDTRYLPQLRANTTGLWAHVFVTQAGVPPDPTAKRHRRLGVAEAHAPLVQYVRKKAVKATKNLLSGDFKDGVDQAAAEELNANLTEPLPHWKGALTLNVVADFSVYSTRSLPPQLRHGPASLVIDRETGAYLPPIFVNEFWRSRERLVHINETTTALPLELDFSCISLMKWQLTAQMQQSMEMQSQMHGEASMEEVKRMLAETNPWLLGLTAFVSVLHTLFDFLAFKNDIAFWKNNKSMKGLSLGSMLLNLFFQTVIFLYLMDNDTSWMILMSSGVGLAIEVWKVKKAVKRVGLIWPAQSGGRLPKLEIVPMDSYTLSSTKVHDEEAMRYLSMLMYPLVVGYSIYSLAHDTHKSWYSWLLGSIVGCVYTFGFIMMTPQLFINYKLKSTAHMPWKTFMYKALNTFVDDLFAFIIKMPTMHRLSCLRDDLIFVCYLYQRWQYGVDKKRPNEYGQVEQDEGGDAADADAAGAQRLEGEPSADSGCARHGGKED